jgi:alpha-beta hydrolase superfamily lysophospholipase
LHLLVAPGDAARPALFLVPGYTDHVGRYGETFAFFRARGHAVWGMDLRGHGHSSGRRGHVDRFDRYLDDLESAVAAARSAHGDGRWVLVGHSTGGLIVLAALLARGGRAPFDAVAGAVVTCPYLRLARAVPLWQRAVGAVAARLTPWLSLTVLAGYEHTHDPVEAARRRADPLIFHTVNARWYHETRRAGERVRAGAEALALPVLALQAGADPVVDASATRDFAARCPRGRYIAYPGMFHEVLLETDRRRVWDDIAAWLDADLGGT